MSSAGEFGPGARKFLKFLYTFSRERNCWGDWARSVPNPVHLEHPARIHLLRHASGYDVRGGEKVFFVFLMHYRFFLCSYVLNGYM
jgi:hypothetical protein